MKIKKANLLRLAFFINYCLVGFSSNYDIYLVHI